jgi:hypothetical protein
MYRYGAKVAWGSTDNVMKYNVTRNREISIVTEDDSRITSEAR